jgi:hypothetical protein
MLIVAVMTLYRVVTYEHYFDYDLVFISCQSLQWGGCAVWDWCFIFGFFILRVFLCFSVRLSLNSKLPQYPPELYFVSILSDYSCLCFQMTFHFVNFKIRNYFWVVICLLNFPMHVFLCQHYNSCGTLCVNGETYVVSDPLVYMFKHRFCILWIGNWWFYNLGEVATVCIILTKSCSHSSYQRLAVFLHFTYVNRSDEPITRPRSPTSCPWWRNWGNSALCSKKAGSSSQVWEQRGRK